MMKVICHILIFMFAGLPCLQSQVIDFSQEVSFEYSGERLEVVLDDLQQRYGIFFSYSRNLIPVDQKIYIKVENKGYKNAMEELFAQTQVVFGFISDQMVLAIDEEKEAIQPDRGMLDDPGWDRDAWAGLDPSIHPDYPRPQFDIPRLQRKISFLKPRNDASKSIVINTSNPLDPPDYFDQLEQSNSSPNLQVTLVPPLQVRTDNDFYDPINFSLNVFWGLNDNVDGVEIGGIGNSLMGNMEGLQMAGIFNTVGGNTTGAQFSSVFNFTADKTLGVAGAGIGNYTGSLVGLQVGGIANVTRDESSGVQIAGIVNASLESGDVVQLAGVVNYGRRKSLLQIAGIANVGDHVKQGQISALLNVAGKVDGFQIGLINIADTVGGPSIGLLSLVKNGYHSFEFGGEDAVHLNGTLRLGTRAFYNIFRFGAKTDEETWALGYGIGSSINMGRRNFLQLELIANHINERELWTDQLNLLNQFHALADIRLGNNWRLAFGPSLNVAVSKRYDPDTDQYGTTINEYDFFNRTYTQNHSGDNINVKAWVGFHIGLRFGSTERIRAPRSEFNSM